MESLAPLFAAVDSVTDKTGISLETLFLSFLFLAVALLAFILMPSKPKAVNGDTHGEA